MLQSRVVLEKRARRVVSRAAHAVAAILVTFFCVQAQTRPPGKIHFVVRTDPAFDPFLKSPTRESVQWFQSHVWRMMVYSPFFDKKLDWYPGGWVYINLYGLHKDWTMVREHPDWLLKDAQNKPLYIPYDCANGSCPLYAADMSNAQYRADWIARARELMAKGYRGLWVDDVNLEFRVSDGFGHQVAPVDTLTGKPMLYEDWKRYVATFCEEIRAAFPKSEILHNSIWYAVGQKRDLDPWVARELQSADYINLERGVADPGLTGGEGEWSLDAFLKYVDRRHAQGKGVIIDNTGNLGAYGIAAYLLISSGKDGLGGHDVTPLHWPAALDIDLGQPLGPRTRSRGLYRREFERGVVLLNEPHAQTEKVTACGECTDVNGRTSSSLQLMPGQAAILLRKRMQASP